LHRLNSINGNHLVSVYSGFYNLFLKTVVYMTITLAILWLGPGIARL